MFDSDTYGTTSDVILHNWSSQRIANDGFSFGLLLVSSEKKTRSFPDFLTIASALPVPNVVLDGTYTLVESISRAKV